FVVLAGELRGPEAALEVLEKLESERRSGDIEARDESVEAAGNLRRLYEGYREQDEAGDEEQRPGLSEGGQERLRSRLGWFGDLALAPEGAAREARAAALRPARRTLVVFVSVFAAGLMGLSIGGFLLAVLVFSAYLGRLEGGLTCPTGRGGIYA